jgi:hypothetical protein
LRKTASIIKTCTYKENKTLFDTNQGYNRSAFVCAFIYQSGRPLFLIGRMLHLYYN